MGSGFVKMTQRRSRRGRIRRPNGLGNALLHFNPLSHFNAFSGFQRFPSLQCIILVSMLSFTSMLYFTSMLDFSFPLSSTSTPSSHRVCPCFLKTCFLPSHSNDSSWFQRFPSLQSFILVSTLSFTSMLDFSCMLLFTSTQRSHRV